MNRIICALDVSKGYADLVLTGPDAQVLHAQCLDDTPGGHQALQTLLRQVCARYPDATVRCGVEATGALERNWMRTLRVLARELPAIETLALNPLAVKRMLGHQLHRAVTDAHSAQGIAHYLRVIDAPVATKTPLVMEGVRMMLGLVNTQGQMEMELRNQLQSFLPFAFPELVACCRNGIPMYVLRLIEKYPGPARLARARLESLTAIPHLTRAQARNLLAAAKQSVTGIDTSPEARLVAEDTEQSMKILAKKILDADQETRRLERLLIGRTGSHPAFNILVSIPGVGELSAARLIALIGDVARFPNSAKLVAFAGLDPVVHESGDLRALRRMSKRGNPRLRSVLYNDALVASRHPGPVQEYYQHLRNAGKPHMVALVACMNKLLRIIYACWLKEEQFDPHHHQDHSVATQNQQHTGTNAAAQSVPPRLNKSSITAPVSGREAKRRLAKQQREEETLLQGTFIPCS